jgi:hypothetical protein
MQVQMAFADVKSRRDPLRISVGNIPRVEVDKNRGHA